MKIWDFFQLVVNLLFVSYLFHIQTVDISALCLLACCIASKNVDLVLGLLVSSPEFKIGLVSYTVRLMLRSVCYMC